VKRIARISAAMVGAMVFVAGAAVAWSQSTPAPAPATQPQQQSVDREGRSFRAPTGDRRFDGRAGDGRSGDGRSGGDARGDGMRPPRMEWRRGDMRPEDFTEPTPEEWKEIEAFMKTHSPERLQRLEDIGDDQRQQGVRNMFAARYRLLQDLKERDPEIYQIRLARMPIEDKATELGWKLMRRQSDKPDDTKSQFRAQIRLLLKSQFEERAIHLRRLEKRLKADEQRIDDIVESNMSDLAEERLPRSLRPIVPQQQRRDRRGDDDTPNTVPASPAPADQ